MNDSKREGSITIPKGIDTIIGELRRLSTMKRFSDEEKAILQSKILQMQTEKARRITKNTKPPLNFVRIIGEFLASLLGISIGLAIFMAFAKAGLPDWIRFLLYFFVIMPSAATPVYLVGTTDNETGSYLATLVGSFLAPISAVIGFNLTRRYK